MTWHQRYRVQHYFASSIWILPSLAVFAALVVVRLLYSLDVWLGMESRFQPENIRTLLVTLAGCMFSIVVFACSALLIAVQLASAQLTPRIIAFVFRNRGMKYSLTLFLFVFAYCLAVLIRTEDSVPRLTANVAVGSCVLSLVVFLYLIDHMGRMLRPSGVLRSVARLGRKVIENVYPRGLHENSAKPSPAAEVPTAEDSRTIYSLDDGAFLAFDVQGLRVLAERSNGVIELVPQVGDYVAVGDPLFRVYGGKSGPTDSQLYESVALGQERTPEQDPIFAFRILVDVASKALSPAINDPTTAVLAIDQIHHLLRRVGSRCLQDERVRDAAGNLRLIYRTPDWEDFVRLAVTEIRHFGGETIQIPRRLRAMLENLIHTLPQERVPLLERELQLLNRFSGKRFAEPEDRALAVVSDMQGVGGHQDSNQHALADAGKT